MTKLNQVIAVEKGVKSRVERAVTDTHKLCQKPAMFSGFEKKYTPKLEDGDVFPAEEQVVQRKATDLIANAGKSWRELFDVTAAKDFGNTHAAADVVVDGVTLIEAAPVTFLLFLDKQLNDIRKFINELPILDPAIRWSKDENQALFTAPSRQTFKTKKVPKSLVLHEGNDKHPPQCEMVAEDIIIGAWDEIKFSGAIPETRKAELLERVENLRNAVKTAREEANGAEVDCKAVGKPVFDWLFA